MAPERESRPGGVGPWPWIPASCVAGVLLGAALALRRRPARTGEPGSLIGAAARTEPLPDDVPGDELPETDRLALERELEAILAASGGVRSPLEQAVTYRGAARNPSSGGRSALTPGAQRAGPSGKQSGRTATV
jgi:hypothetical protein